LVVAPTNVMLGRGMPVVFWAKESAKNWDLTKIC
jgi:hypothetical protein